VESRSADARALIEEGVDRVEKRAVGAKGSKTK
jgi:hypothetical protein